MEAGIAGCSGVSSFREHVLFQMPGARGFARVFQVLQSAYVEHDISSGMRQLCGELFGDDGCCMGKVTSVSVIIPFFNEASRLPSTLREIEDFIQAIPDVIGEVICVDDGSTDNGKTIERALYWQGRIPLSVEQLKVNSGKWAALHHGIRVAKGPRILLMDADGSASIWNLRRLVRFEAGAAFGSRFMKNSKTEGKGPFRTLLSQGYRWLTQLFMGPRYVDDMQCPFKLFHKAKLKQGLLKISRFAGDIELALALDELIYDVPVTFIHKKGSKFPLHSSLMMFCETIEVFLRHKRGEL